MSSWLSVTIQQSRPEGAPKLKAKSPMQENKRTTLTQPLRPSDRREIQQISKWEKRRDSHRGLEYHLGSTFALRWDSDTHPVSG